MSESKITQKALANTMKELLSAKPLAKISVGEICSACGISRKSFYYHFRDKYELVNWIFYSEFLNDIADKEYSSGWRYLLDLCQYFYANRAFYLHAFEVAGQNSFSEYFYDVCGQLITDYFSQLAPDDKDYYVSFKYLAEMILSTIVHWLKEDNPPEPQYFLKTGKAAMMVIIRLLLEHGELDIS